MNSIVLYVVFGVTFASSFALPLPLVGGCRVEMVVVFNGDLIPPWHAKPTCVDPAADCAALGLPPCDFKVVDDGWIIDTITCACGGKHGTPSTTCHFQVDVNPDGWMSGSPECVNECDEIPGLWVGDCHLDFPWPTTPYLPATVFPECDCDYYIPPFDGEGY